MVHKVQQLVRSQSFLFVFIIVCAFVASVFVAGGTSVIAQFGGGGGGPQLGCWYGGYNGAFCASDGDCSSGNCVGGSGSCVSGSLGTCQPVPPSCVDQDWECDDNLDCNQNGTVECAMISDPNYPGCPEYGICLDEVCTTGVPNPPQYIEAYFVDADTINVTIPPPQQNGEGAHHNLRIVLATQDLDQVAPNFALVDAYFPLSFATITGPINLSFGGAGPQPVKVGVRNYDTCQDIYGPWKIASPITPPQPPNGGSFSCTGTTPGNATLCANDDTGLTVDTQKKLVESCGAPKCEYTCNSGYVYSNGACVLAVPAEVGNVFGWAWSQNIGWVKMNSCDDLSPFDGQADAGSCGSIAYGVKVNNNGVMGGPGIMSGHAWSDKVGWIKFGGYGTSEFPNTVQAPGTVATNAFIANVTGTSGDVKGWARVLTGGVTDGFDGWISMSGTNYPTGAPYIDGSRGVTYHPPTARLVGWAWAGDVLGWIHFSGDTHKVTYGSPSSTFDYSLSASPLNLTIEKGAEAVTTVTRSLVAGISEAVTLSLSAVSGPGRNRPTVQIISNPTCNPDCESEIEISVPSNADAGNYTFTVTGTPDDVTTDSEQVTIGVTVPTSGGAGPIVATCEPSGNPPYLVNNPITWTSNVTGGLPPYTYTWTGTDALSGSGSSVTKTYATTGNKQAFLEIRDSSVPQLETEITCTTPSGVNQITIVVQPNIIEF